MGPSLKYHPPEGVERETLLEHVLPSLGRTHCRVLLAATAPFPHVAETLCPGTFSRAIGG